MNRPDKEDYPLDGVMYLLMLETYADHLELDIDDANTLLDEMQRQLNPITR